MFMSLMIYRGEGAARKKIFVFAADFLAYIDKSPLKASALRRPVVHKRLSDFVAPPVIQEATRYLLLDLVQISMLPLSIY
jgi:hypothetical protein